MEAGELVDTEGHMMAPQPNSPTGTSRLPFSNEEDSLLIRWAKQGKLGTDKGAGNRAFQELAQLHPSRTWQSWRERWVKHLQPAIGRQIEKERREAADMRAAEKIRRGEPVSDEEEEREEEEEFQEAPEEAPRQAKRERNGGKRREFTASDDEILLDWVNQPGQRATKGNELFKRIEAEVRARIHFCGMNGFN